MCNDDKEHVYLTDMHKTSVKSKSFNKVCLNSSRVARNVHGTEDPRDPEPKPCPPIGIHNKIDEI